MWIRSHNLQSNQFLVMFRCEPIKIWLNHSAMTNSSTAFPKASSNSNYSVRLAPVSSGNNVELFEASLVDVRSNTKTKRSSIFECNSFSSAAARITKWNGVVVGSHPSILNIQRCLWNWNSISSRNFQPLQPKWLIVKKVSVPCSTELLIGCHA